MAISPEANWGVGGESPVPTSAQEALFSYTAKQRDRILVFQHLVTLARMYEKKLDAGEINITYGYTAPNGSRTVFFPIDRRFVGIVKNMAFHLYADEFSRKPEMKEAADDILAQMKEESLRESDETQRRCIKIWEASDRE